MNEKFIKDGKYTQDDLLAITELLRGANGCPWDREQTHKSIRNNFIEEVYEAVEAIDGDDPVLLCEELGDVLLQVVFHSRIAEERGDFSFGDVCDGICRKLIVRHPHVFGNAVAADGAEVLKNWNAIKMETKEIKKASDDMKRLPPSLPALMKAQKIGKKSASAGFDYDDAFDALEKVREETEEVLKALNGDGDAAEEIGDLLLAVSETARHAGFDAEEALNSANGKFVSRFSLLEEEAAAKKIDLKTADKFVKEQLWTEIKAKK